MQNKIWEYRDEKLSKEQINILSETFNLPYEMAVLLLNRGIFGEQELAGFMKKGLDNVHNPFLLNDMDLACDRIITAINQKEKITVYGDYDVDGITSTAVLTDFLESLGADVDYYIPNRFKEGYGLNAIAINKIAKNRAGLLITVDCGITSVGEVELAKTLKLDVIITDHHTCKDELPKAIAVINPKRKDSTYPFCELAGVGVVFKLILALAKNMGISTKDTFLKYVDLVTIGTIADVVPLVDENRVIVDKGITAIENTNNNGIKALLEVSGTNNREKNAMLVAFSIAPRLNAAGRMENAKISVELFKEKDYGKAVETATYLDSLNRNRQQTEQKILEEALEEVSKFQNEQLVYVLNHKDWHEGIIGIVASKLCEKFYRPCILLSESENKCKGSGRSIDGLNLFDALSNCEDVLTAFGGHSLAAGLSILPENIPIFRERINKYAKQLLTEDKLIPKLYIDCKLNPKNITIEWAEAMKRLEPFGAGNEIPVFALSDAEIISASGLGEEAKHLRIKLQKDGMTFNAVGFGMGEFLKELKSGEKIDIAYNLNINTYQGKDNLQLLIKDIKK